MKDSHNLNQISFHFQPDTIFTNPDSEYIPTQPEGFQTGDFGKRYALWQSLKDLFLDSGVLVSVSQPVQILEKQLPIRHFHFPTLPGTEGLHLW